MLVPLFGHIVISFLMTKLIYPLIRGMLIEGNCLKDNYKGERIPVCTGLVFIPIITLNLFITLLWVQEESYILSIVFFLSTLGMGLAGLLDDILGNRNVSGLKGHFQSLIKGNLTTGGFKAVFGGGIALVVSTILSDSIYDVVLNTLIIALFTNFINLLDLRPGRAIKGYLFFTVILIISLPMDVLKIMQFGLASSVIVYLPFDLKAKAMLGDVGSNILGISLGVLCASSALALRIVIFVFLVLFHVYTEKYSLTQTIEKNRFLRYLDQVGR